MSIWAKATVENNTVAAIVEQKLDFIRDMMSISLL